MSNASRRSFFAKQVAELLEIEDPIRVKNYSDVAAYGIKPQHVGTGRGSRKVYDFDDVLRIAVAELLFRFGFAARAIGEALGEIQKSKLNPHNGEFLLVNSQTKGLVAANDVGWKVIPRDDEREWRRSKSPEFFLATFVFDITAAVGPVWRRAGAGEHE